MAENRQEQVAAVVLAAGMSTRMGTFKQLLPFGGRTLIEWVVDQLTPVLQRVVVVVGHRGAEVREALGTRRVDCVTNLDFAAGMCSSVQCGIRRAGPAGAYLICLGDQPVLAGLLGPLLAAAETNSQGILIPTFRGRRGHPLLLRERYAAAALALGPDQGLNTLTRAHPEDTLEVPLSEPGALEDLDTPADYERVMRQLREATDG